MILTESTMAMLEWPEFLRFFSTFIDSQPGKETAADLRPLADLDQQRQLTREALDCVRQDRAPSFRLLEFIPEILHRASIENDILEGVEIYRVYRLAALNNENRNRISGWKQEFPNLQKLGSRLPDLKELEQVIPAVIDPSGEVSEDASPELTRIRKQTSHLKAKVERSLERYLKDSRYSSALQEQYVTYRHGRAVLLVRSEHKSAIRGVIHGESGSGASVFLEPLQALEANNELAQLADRRLQETTRILRQLTALIGRDSAMLQLSARQLVDLDVIFARGRFGKAFECSLPEITDRFEIDLREARHPLLEATLRKQNRTVVPFALQLEPDTKALVVTGPNTGGKTVFLKTAGLLCLMAHCALPLPAGEGSRVPRLAAIHADVGDQQSIAESLSTFSSHITNIVRILSDLQDHSLVLLDELGTGTDPEEGAPLAVAILQELLQRKIKAIITSHHSQMKVFAWNHPECKTAAMEFDTEHLRPTYRILPDQIGASHGLEIAGRLGIPPAILERARALSGDQQKQVQEFQLRLQERIRSLEKTRALLEQEKKEWEERAREQEQKLETMREKLQQQLKTLREQNTDLLRTLNAKFETLLETIQDAQIRREIKQQYKKEVVPEMERIENLTEPAESSPRAEFKPGDRVWVNLYKDFGEIVAIRKNQAELILRNKRFTVPLSTLEKRESVAESLPKGIRLEVPQKEVERELNLIGQTVEEALATADKYLDDAVLGQLPEVRLIHGHGTGKLRRAIEEMLAAHPHVQSYRSESHQHGGSGVTIVELRSLR